MNTTLTHAMATDWVAQSIAEVGTDATNKAIIALVYGDPERHDALRSAWDVHPQVKTEFEAFMAGVRARSVAALRQAPSTGRRFAGLLRKVMQASEGSRNGTLYFAACRCAEMAAESAITREQAEDALTQAAGYCGLPCGEATSTVRSAFRRIGSAS